MQFRSSLGTRPNLTKLHEWYRVLLFPCDLTTCRLVVLKGRLRWKLEYVTGDREHCRVLRQMQFVHIDDLASAHIFLMECPQATRRYICSSADTTIHTLSKFLSNRFPEFPIPTEWVSQNCLLFLYIFFIVLLNWKQVIMIVWSLVLIVYWMRWKKKNPFTCLPRSSWIWASSSNAASRRCSMKPLIVVSKRVSFKTFLWSHGRCVPVREKESWAVMHVFLFSFQCVFCKRLFGGSCVSCFSVIYKKWEMRMADC